MHRLIISQPNAERDSGDYYCHIENAAGFTENKISVDVEYLLNPLAPQNIKKGHVMRVEREAVDRKLKALEHRRLCQADLGPSFNLDEMRKDIQRKDTEKTRLVLETYLKTTAVVEGSTANFLCAVRGKSGQVKWLHNGKELMANPNKYQIQERKGVCVLQVYRVEMADAGCYECQLENSINSVTTSSQLIVQEGSKKKIQNQLPSTLDDLRLDGEFNLFNE